MLSRKELGLLIAVSFCVTVAIGMTDDETESLVHLFTAEWGNIFTMTLLTGLFTVVLSGLLMLGKAFARQQAGR